ncbi:hypothetical protein M0R45_029915 [Rubus argutus]|uniref:Uncharacterized protein n=1 Tax=Rubus argutus TaxID=59490 RepID=A0AAW1WD28_RUBAR
MSRPWVLVCLLLLIVFTSQLEWKQQYGNDETSPNPSKKQQYISERGEAVKERLSSLKRKIYRNLMSLCGVFESSYYNVEVKMRHALLED